MPITLDPTLRRELAARIRYYNDLGIYDFYRRDSDPASGDIQPEERESMTQRASAVEERLFENASSRPELTAADPSQALRTVREDLGDCTRCRLHKQGRNPIALIILLSNWPARPTNGSPCSSSSAPGALPMNIKSAR